MPFRRNQSLRRDEISLGSIQRLGSISTFSLALFFSFAALIYLAMPAMAKTGHWAFETIKRPPIPTITSTRQTRNSIDSFIIARLNEENLSPSPEAPRRVLIRRLSLDLLGLIPSLHEVEAFANDCRPDAYERLVDRYL